MKYLLYLRVSTDEQDEETQLDHCMRFIKARDKSEFKYEIYRDKITSRKPLFEREGGKALLAAINKGDIVIAMRLDRVARKLHETTQLIHILDTRGAEIFLVEQPGINNKIMLGLYAGMAEEEVKLLRKRVSEKLESKKNRNERYSRHLPYGYGMHETKTVSIRVGNEIVQKPGVLVPIEEEQTALAQMCQLFDKGMSYQNIATTLTKLGYMNREGKPFQKMSIYRILSRTEQTKSSGQPQEEKAALAFR